MFSKSLFSLALLYFSSISAHAMNADNTLGANDTVDNRLIEKLVDSATAQVLLNAPYKGFYEIKSKISANKIIFSKLQSKSAYPDERWAEVAKGLAQLIEFPAYLTGTRIDPQATAYVAFYDIEIEGLDISTFQHIPTSIDSAPNTMAVLVIKHRSHGNAKETQFGQTVAPMQNDENLYFLKLAL
jgi:hypothetical protein